MEIYSLIVRERPVFFPLEDTLGLIMAAWLLACLCSDLLLQVCCLEQEAVRPLPELTLSGSLFIWSQSLASVTGRQLDQ